MMYYVIIVMLLHIVCITLITAPFVFFCEITVEFLVFVLSTARTFTVVNVSCYDINFISKYLGC